MRFTTVAIIAMLAFFQSAAAVPVPEAKVVARGTEVCGPADNCVGAW